MAPTGDGQLRKEPAGLPLADADPPAGGCLFLPRLRGIRCGRGSGPSPGKYRAVIHLFYYEGYQTEEIARILGRSPSTVRAQLTRARQKLRTLLKEDI